MNNLNKSEIFQSLIESYQFIVDDFGYKIIDEERSTPLFFYIRYENKSVARIISVGIDLRENDFDIAIWKSSDGWTRDEDMLEFESYLKEKGMELQSMPEGVLDKKAIAEVNKKNADLFRKYGSKLIAGEDY